MPAREQGITYVKSATIFSASQVMKLHRHDDH